MSVCTQYNHIVVRGIDLTKMRTDYQRCSASLLSHHHVLGNGGLLTMGSYKTICQHHFGSSYFGYMFEEDTLKSTLRNVHT